MASAELTVAGSYFRQIGAILGPQFVALWLARAGLDESALDEDAITLSFDLFQELLLDAMAQSKEPAFGLFLGERLIARTHGFVGYAALNSRSLKEVLEVLERFVPLRFSIVSLSHWVCGNEVRLTVAPSLPLGLIARPLLEAILLSLRNVLDAVSLGGFVIKALAFPFPTPSYAELAEDMVGTKVLYDQEWTGLALSAALLEAPIALADPAAFEEAARICERRLSELEANESTAGQVRAMLFQPANGFPSLAATARRLHLSSRTLHRRLVAEGTSFRALTDEVRFRLAVDHLVAGRASVEEIAYMLGYSDTANFSRAFRRWSGKAPSKYRAQSTPPS